MNLADFPWGELITIGVLMLSVALLAMDERNRRKFITRDEANGMRTRIEEKVDRIEKSCERNNTLYVMLDDRTGDLEEKTSLLEERQSQQWERISEQMANTAATIREVTHELKEISKMQQDHAIRLERNNRNNNGG